MTLPDTQILLDIAVPVALDRSFTYRWPPENGEVPAPGTRVVVSFGSKWCVAIVRGRSSHRVDPKKIKNIETKLDGRGEETISAEIAALCEWISEYYLAPIGEVFRLALPSSLLSLDERAVVLAQAGELALARAQSGPLLAGPGECPDSDAHELLRSLAGGQVELGALAKGWPRRGGFWRTLTASEHKGWVTFTWPDQVALETRTTLYIRLSPVFSRLKASEGELQHAIGRSKQRRGLLDFLDRGAESGWVAITELLSAFPRARVLVRELVERELLETQERPREQMQHFSDASAGSEIPLLATQEQRGVLAKLSHLLESRSFHSVLLHGVTGSGKTEVYLQLISQALEAGGGAIVLVPEIALTPQLSGRFRARFGKIVAVLHSGLTPRQRLDAWQQIRSGTRRIVIGARSAIFAPVPDLRVIVVDEEHDGSFKQEDGVRYHARDVALVRAQRLGALVVMGSATPSLESYQLAMRGKHVLLSMHERVMSRPLPEVELLSLVEHRTEQNSLLTARMRDAILATGKAGEQAIIFLNRRGYAPQLRCAECNEAIRCPDCSTLSITLHRQRDRMMCHLCGHMADIPKACPACSHPKLVMKGTGTERVEEELTAALAPLRVLRLDRDTSRGKGLAEVLGRFRAREADVLVGTQILAKGHDFPGVTLVGVLVADHGLALPDPRAAEKVFALLTQVAGRAGRGERPGRVLVQTWNAEQHPLPFAKHHDYLGFVAAELRYRQDVGNPPTGYLAMIRVTSTVEALVKERIAEIAQELRARIAREKATLAGVELLGPVASPIERINQRFRWQLLLRSRERAVLRLVLAAMRGQMGEQRTSLGTSQATIDVDPCDFL